MTAASAIMADHLGPDASYPDIPAPRFSVYRSTSGGRLWTSSAAMVLALHAGALAVAVLWSSSVDQPPPPPAAMMIELAPLAAPPAPPTEKPQGELKQAAKPIQPVVEKPQPKPIPKKAEVALPKPVPKPETKKTEEAPPAEQVVERTTAPQSAEAPVSQAQAAPNMAPSMPSNSNAVPTWQGTLRAHLERHKRYPQAAQFRRQQGVTYVRFSMGRDGMVRWARLERPSGHDRLDDESLALMERAQPLPVPPPEVPGDPIEIVVPIQFFLK